MSNVYVLCHTVAFDFWLFWLHVSRHASASRLIKIVIAKIRIHDSISYDSFDDSLLYAFDHNTVILQYNKQGMVAVWFKKSKYCSCYLLLLALPQIIYLVHLMVDICLVYYYICIPLIIIRNSNSNDAAPNSTQLNQASWWELQLLLC